MLNGYVEILDYLVVVGYLIDKLIVKLIGIGVVEPYPLDAVDIRELSAQLGKAAPAVKVCTVTGYVLRDNDKLFNAVARQILSLLKNVFHRP